jgi:hypothetical protein
MFRQMLEYTVVLRGAFLDPRLPPATQQRICTYASSRGSGCCCCYCLSPIAATALNTFDVHLRMMCHAMTAAVRFVLRVLQAVAQLQLPNARMPYFSSCHLAVLLMPCLLPCLLLCLLLRLQCCCVSAAHAMPGHAAASGAAQCHAVPRAACTVHGKCCCCGSAGAKCECKRKHNTRVMMPDMMHSPFCT